MKASLEIHTRRGFAPAFCFFILMLCWTFSAGPAMCSERRETMSVDRKVSAFLQGQREKWRDWNVPYADGKALYDLIARNNYRKALEVGTSTGHSAIWIAWALSKTGGRLVTIEINEARHKEAVSNFEKAGLSDYIDARLGDAHELVKELKGPFDFVFSDADKEWYKNYFVALAPKLEVGGCFTAHNVSWTHDLGIKEFLDYVKSLSNFETEMIRTSSEGISASYKRAAD
jgi:caffeoyl-CoA O-methyltransferase